MTATAVKGKLMGKGLLMGLAAGAIVWVFLKLLALATGLLWTTLPGVFDTPLYTLIVCTVGGLLTGLLRRKCGDYPEELTVVLGKIQTEKFYDYTKLPVLLIAAFLPLVFASSVGPEAGLVGIVSALCYWTAAVLKRCAGRELTKQEKRLSYGAAIVLGLGTYTVLNEVLGAAMEGFPMFEAILPRGKGLLLALLYIPVGVVLAKYYDLTHHGCHAAAAKLPPVVRETVAGLLLGATAIFVPQVLFSGESEIHHLMSEYVNYAPLALLGIALVKVLMTNICIQGGLKGGHFFPLIYAGVLVGYGLAMLLCPEQAAQHVVFGAAVVTASMLGANMKQPILVSLILLICFPVRLIFWLVIAACAGSAIVSIGKDKQRA